LWVTQSRAKRQESAMAGTWQTAIAIAIVVEVVVVVEVET
jgi:hypothetical protein